MSRVLFAIALAGCGFQLPGGQPGDGAVVGDGASSDGNDDGALDDGAIDAPVDGSISPASCAARWINHTISFGTAVPLTTINSTSFERDPFVSTDELTIWFSSGNSMSQGGGDVFVATRTNKALPFGSPSRDNSSYNTSGGAESKMSMTTARTYAVVASSQAGGAGDADVWETSRANTTASWGALVRTRVMALASAGGDYDPFVTSDGLRIYYAPTTPAPQHIAYAKRSSTSDNFDAPADVVGVNTTAGEADPTVFANERVIVFTSARTATHPLTNLWYATRNNADDPFGAPLEVPGVNTDYSDGDPHVSADGCTLYFGRNIGGGVDWELFSASATL